MRWRLEVSHGASLALALAWAGTVSTQDLLVPLDNRTVFAKDLGSWAAVQ